jgi:hypothetical protein
MAWKLEGRKARIKEGRPIVDNADMLLYWITINKVKE